MASKSNSSEIGISKHQSSSVSWDRGPLGILRFVYALYRDALLRRIVHTAIFHRLGG